MFKTLFPVSLAASVTASVMAVPYAVAQITPALDGTGTSIQQQGQQFNIDGGSLSDDGQNLFHSFEQFGLSSGQVADFFAQPNVQNVLGRVVGGDTSVINGTLQVSGSAANLFLMNPAGVVFGNDAQLNVPGDFTATTATGIEFGTGQWFNAASTNSYGQLTGAPTGFHLGGGSIVNSGDLAVGLGRQLSLVGNSVANVGSLSAPEGHILITALPGEGVLQLKFPGYSLGLELDLIDDPVSVPTAWTLPVAALGDLLRLDAVRSADAVAGVPDVPGTALVSGQVDVSGSQGGTVGIFGDRVGLFDAQVNADGTLGGGQVLIGGEYQGQGTSPTAMQTVIDRESTVEANATLAGNGGEVIVWADETTQFYGSISAQGGLTLGDGGFVEVSGKDLLIYRGDVAVSSPTGTLGTLLLDPQNITIVNGSGGTLNAPLDNDITFDGDGLETFTISEDAIEAHSGSLILKASGDIRINNLDDGSDDPNTGQLAFQPGVGEIRFEAGEQFIMDNQNDRIETSGRNITIVAGDSILAGNIRSDGIGLSSAGSISLIAENGSLEVGSLRAIFSLDGNDINGGNITLNAPNGSLTINASEADQGVVEDDFAALGIAAFSSGGNAGLIDLRASNDIKITCPQSLCIESFAGGNSMIAPRGNGANIFINSLQGSINISSDAPISLNSFISEMDGDIPENLEAGDISLIARNDITFLGDINTSSLYGSAGIITITSSEGTVTTGAIKTSGNIAGDIDLASIGALQVSDINTYGTTSSGNIRLNSATESVTAGNLTAGSVITEDPATTQFSQIGGVIDIAAINDIQIESINTQGIDTGGRLDVNSIAGGIVIGSIQSGSDGAGGIVDVASVGDIQIDSINANGIPASNNVAGEDFYVNVNSADGNIVVGDVQATSNATSGFVDIASRGNVEVASIDTQGTTGGGRININSAEGTAIAGTVQTSSANGTGGQVNIAGAAGTQVGTVSSQGALVGGAVNISSVADVEVTNAINAQGDNVGGTVEVFATNGSIVVGDIQSTSNNTGGLVDIVSDFGTVQVNSIDTQGTTTGGQVNVNAVLDTVTVDTIQSSGGQTGGQVDVVSGGTLQVNSIASDGTTTNGGAVTVTSNSDAIVNSIQANSTDGTGGTVTVDSENALQIGSIGAQGGAQGGSLNINSGSDSTTLGDVQISADQVGGTLNINAPNFLQLGDIDASGTFASGGTVQLTSETESVTVGNIQSVSNNQGGSVNISAPNSVQVGNVDVQGTAVSGGTVQLASTVEGVTVGNIQADSNNQGGSVTIVSPDTIQTGFIDAQGGAAGGLVDITTENLFRSTSSFTDNNGINASISTAGATDGQVIIRHDGGNQTIPFMVGDASVNGTAGAITTGANNTIPATRGFIGSYTQGDIQIITADFFEPESAEFPPPQELAELQETPFWLDEYFTRQYEAYMGDGEETAVKSLDEIQQILGDMGEATGVKPALVYVIFEPGNLVSEIEDASDFANRGDLMRIEPTPGDEIYLVLVTPEGVPTARRVDASGATRGSASDSIGDFRRALFEAIDRPDSGVVPASTQQQAQNMYQWFLEPLRAEIDTQGVDNLVYIMEAGLRSAPLATLSAMHDGDDYTIRDYSIGLMPSFSLTDTRYQDIRHAELRAMGSSSFDSARSLPAAEVELATVSDIWAKRQANFGERSHPPMQNEAFTWENLSQQNSDQLGILHLATHANFDPAVPQDSFIRLSGDEQIPFASLREMSLPIELLVLSACETALEGNSHEAELGFGGLAVQTGVKSALASLWSVDDAGTFALMSAFYGYLNGNESEAPIIKAEALRQAQIAMLDNQVRVEDGYLYYSETESPVALPESFQRYLEQSGNPALNVSHPFYWAGFTMIGSPW